MGIFVSGTYLAITCEGVGAGGLVLKEICPVWHPFIKWYMLSICTVLLVTWFISYSICGIYMLSSYINTYKVFDIYTQFDGHIFSGSHSIVLEILIYLELWYLRSSSVGNSKVRNSDTPEFCYVRNYVTLEIPIRQKFLYIGITICQKLWHIGLLRILICKKLQYIGNFVMLEF